MWGQNARDAKIANAREGQILAIKGARVSEYKGKTLNAGEDHSQIYLDPTHKRAKELKQWYLDCSQKNFDSISNIDTMVGSNGPTIERVDNFKLIEEMLQCCTESQSSYDYNGR